jgi:hypothetical protein
MVAVPGLNNSPFTGTGYPQTLPINSLTNAGPQTIISSYNSFNIPIGPCGSNLSPKKRSRLKSGFKLDATSTEEAKPVAPRRERREARSPEIVGGGPMRRRWR